MGRKEQLEEFIRSRPDDPFPRYALALELKNQGALDEAHAVFAELIARAPDYTAAYLHAGNTEVARGDREAAERLFCTGIDVCARKRDAHALGELEAALAELRGGAS